AVLLIEMRQDFGIRRAVENVAAGLELRAQFAIVINLSVEDDRDALVFVIGGLLSGHQVDDRQPAHAERDTVTNDITFGVRTAMKHPVAHRAQQLARPIRWRGARVKIRPSGYSTHVNGE